VVVVRVEVLCRGGDVVRLGGDFCVVVVAVQWWILGDDRVFLVVHRKWW